MTEYDKQITALRAKWADEERTEDLRIMNDRRYRWRVRFRNARYGLTSAFYTYRSAPFRRMTYVRLWRRITRGWDDSDTWNLDISFAEWMLPRLRRYRKVASKYIVITPEQEARIVTAIAALEIIRDGRDNYGTEDEDLANRGLQIIAEDIRGWWW